MYFETKRNNKLDISLNLNFGKNGFRLKFFKNKCHFFNQQIIKLATMKI